MRERLCEAETRVLQRFSTHERHGPLRLAMLGATRLADGWGQALLIVVALILGGATRGVAAIGLGIVSGVATAIVVQSIKALVRRQRPIGIELDRPIAAPDKHAFPSGHTSQAFVMVVTTWWLSPTLGVIVLVVAVMVGLSRMFFGLHYPTDVVVGALLGLAIAWWCLAVMSSLGIMEWLQRLA